MSRKINPDEISFDFGVELDVNEVKEVENVVRNMKESGHQQTEK